MKYCYIYFHMKHPPGTLYQKFTFFHDLTTETVQFQDQHPNLFAASSSFSPKSNKFFSFSRIIGYVYNIRTRALLTNLFDAKEKREHEYQSVGKSGCRTLSRIHNNVTCSLKESIYLQIGQYITTSRMIYCTKLPKNIATISIEF